MKLKGIIFDLDGVICFTDEYHYLAWKELADRLGIPFDRKDNERLRGVSRMASLEIILEKSEKAYTEAEKQSFCEEKNNRYREYLSRMTPADLSEETASTLLKLRERGYLLAIGSSSRNAKTILEKIGLGSFFDAVSDGTNITRTKPDPQVFLMAAEMLKLPPEECLVVEDAEAGIAAAKAGGMQAAGMGGAAADPCADYSLSCFSDLLKVL